MQRAEPDDKLRYASHRPDRLMPLPVASRRQRNIRATKRLITSPALIQVQTGRRDGLPCCANAAKRLSDRRMPGVEGMASNATRACNGGNSTA